MGEAFSNCGILKFFFGGEKWVARKITKVKIRKETVQFMTDAGTYKPLYDGIIDLYVDTMFQYLSILKTFEEEGMEVGTETAANGQKTAPIVKALENLRKDLMQLSDRLMLNPKSYGGAKKSNSSKSKLVNITNKYGT